MPMYIEILTSAVHGRRRRSDEDGRFKKSVRIIGGNAVVDVSRLNMVESREIGFEDALDSRVTRTDV